ncbi:hypothetical protein Q7P35_010855 [Cladosporium inversicolor]
MAFPNHTATEIITAAARYSPSVTTAKQQNAVNSTEPPEDATVTFTQQDAPLLRIPGELRNRIYHEIFRATFDELEMNKEAQKRTLHTSRFFARTASLCRTIKRCAPNTHLAVEHLGLGFSTRRITPANARAFLEELTCQVQQDVCVNFKTSPHFTERKLCRTRTSDAATWDALWKLEESCFEAEGSVGGYCFTYSRWRKGSGHLFRSSRKLEGCLAQLDWQALESSVKEYTILPTGHFRRSLVTER